MRMVSKRKIFPPGFPGREHNGGSLGEWSAYVAGGLVLVSFLLFVGKILWDLISAGITKIELSFFVENPNEIDGGGIFSVLVSTFWILVIAIGSTLPIAISTAIWLNQSPQKRTRIRSIVRISLDVLAGVPSVVFGLAGQLFFCQFLAMGYSILAGGLTLACMILPLMTRVFEDSFRSIPSDYLVAAKNLGLSKATTVFRILLPQAFGGIVVGTLLALCRAVSETAALLFTSGSVYRTPTSLFDSGRTLSVHVYELAMNPGGDSGANATALVLIVLVLATSGFASFLTFLWRRRQ